MSEQLLKVYTPNKNFGGYRYGVKFVKGVGMATAKQAKVLVANFKYSCPELEAPKEPGEGDKGESSDNPEATKMGNAKTDAGDKPENTSAKQPLKWTGKRN